MQLSQMVDKVLEHKPHSIYFVEGAKALSKESGILKKSLKHVGVVVYPSFPLFIVKMFW